MAFPQLGSNSRNPAFQDGTNANRNLLMGKVEIKMFDGIPKGYQDKHKDITHVYRCSC
jgi:hypothetical protein